MAKYSIKTERYWLKKYDIEPNPRSGRGRWLKGDGTDDLFVWDVKEAEKSFHFNENVWIKICTDAYKTDPYKDPALLIILGGRTELALIEANALKGIRDELREVKKALEELLKMNDDA
jgi:hypothetical protein